MKFPPLANSVSVEIIGSKYVNTHRVALKNSQNWLVPSPEYRKLRHLVSFLQNAAHNENVEGEV